MTTKHENPAEGGASETITKATEFVLPIVPHAPDVRPLRISETADDWIEARADDLAQGRVSLPDLPRALRSLYFTGYAHGEQSQRERIDRLTYERDRYYWISCNPGKTGADFMRGQTSALWDQAVAS